MKKIPQKEIQTDHQRSSASVWKPKGTVLEGSEDAMWFRKQAKEKGERVDIDDLRDFVEYMQGGQQDSDDGEQV